MKHRREQHGVGNEAKHVCEICGARWKFAHALKVHIACKHSSERPHLCHICGRDFKFKFNLRNHHQRAHSDKRPYR